MQAHVLQRVVCSWGPGMHRSRGAETKGLGGGGGTAHVCTQLLYRILLRMALSFLASQ